MIDSSKRWAIYARRLGHKRAHPCSPSKGIYNCSLDNLDRYATKREAADVCASLSQEFPHVMFFVRYLRFS